MSSGYVYILTNESMPGLVKIGKTTRCPDGRALELDTTGVPTPFKVVHYVFAPDCHALERYVHELMPDLRVRDSREFFRADTSLAIGLLDDAHRDTVEKWLCDFIPDSVVVHEEAFVDVGSFNKSVVEVVSKYGLVPPEFAEVLYELTGEEIEPAVIRQQKKAAARIQEYRSRKSPEAAQE